MGEARTRFAKVILLGALAAIGLSAPASKALGDAPRFKVYLGEGPRKMTATWEAMRDIDESLKTYDGGISLGLADSRYLGPATARYACYPNGTSDANVQAAIVAANAAGGGEIDVPPGSSSGVWAPIQVSSAWRVTNSVHFVGVDPTFTFPNSLPDSDVTFTGGTVLTPVTTNSYPAFEGFYNTGTLASPVWVANDTAAPTPTAGTYPTPQAWFSNHMVVNAGISHFGVSGGFTNNISIGNSNNPGCAYFTFDHLWLRAATGWGLWMCNSMHAIQADSIFAYNNGSSGTGNVMIKGFCDFTTVLQTGNCIWSHVYSFQQNATGRGIVIEAQGDPTISTSIGSLNEEVLIRPQCNRFNATNTFSQSSSSIAPTAATCSSGAGTSITVGLSTGITVNTPLVDTVVGSTMPGFTQGTVYYCQSVIDSTHITLAATVGGSAIAATGSSTGSPTLSQVGVTVASTSKAIVGEPMSWTAGTPPAGFTEYWNYIVWRVVDTTHLILSLNKGSTAGVIATGAATATLTSQGFPNIEVNGLLSGGVGATTGSEGTVNNSSLDHCDTEGTTNAGIEVERCVGIMISFDQVPNGTSHAALADLMLRNTNTCKYSCEDSLNTDLDGASVQSQGDGALNVVLQHSGIFFGQSTGETAAGVGGTNQWCIQLIGSAAVNGAAFVPDLTTRSNGGLYWSMSTFTAQHYNSGNGPSQTLSPIAAGYYTIAPSAPGTTRTLPIIVTDSSPNTSTLGLQFIFYNTGTYGAIISSQSSQQFNEVTGATSYVLAPGFETTFTALKDASGTLYWGTRTVPVNYGSLLTATSATVGLNVNTVYVSASGQTVTIPGAQACQGMRMTIKNNFASAASTTVSVTASSIGTQTAGFTSGSSNFTLSSTYGNYPVGTVVQFSGTVPTGISTATNYWVVSNNGTSAVQVSATPGGSAISVTSTASPTIAAVNEIDTGLGTLSSSAGVTSTATDFAFTTWQSDGFVWWLIAKG